MLWFAMDGDQQVPPDGTGTSGECVADLDAGLSTLDLFCTHDVSDTTVAHIHEGAPGENGDPIHDLGDGSSPIDTMVTPSALDLARLAGGLLYVNVHSSVNTGGEIRGQMVDTPVFEDGFESGDTGSWAP